MVCVEFLGPIARPNVELDISSLKELKEYFKGDETLLEWLKICSVAINGKIASSLDTNLKDGDRITLLPPVCGG